MASNFFADKTFIRIDMHGITILAMLRVLKNSLILCNLGVFILSSQVSLFCGRTFDISRFFCSYVLISRLSVGDRKITEGLILITEPQRSTFTACYRRYNYQLFFYHSVLLYEENV